MEKVINLQNIKNSFQDILETQQLWDNECKLFQENIEKLDFYLRKFKLAWKKSSWNNKPNLELLKDIWYYLLWYLTNPVWEDFIEHIKYFKQDWLNIWWLIFEILYEYIKLQEEYDDKKNDLIDYIFYSSICYSLAWKEANSIFMAKKLEEYVDDDVLFLVISKTLQRRFKDIISNNYSIADWLTNSIIKVLYDNAYLFVYWVDSSSELINNLDWLLEIKKELIETWNSQLLFIVSKIEEVVKVIINNSVWKILLDLDYSKDYILSLTNYWKNNIYELWEWQRKIIENIINQNENRILINMPTSWWKSLVAELQIINILQENDSQKVIYVVPTNALANQVEDDLFSKFRVLWYKVSNTIDLWNDITELSENVIILTPEKLDLLIRKETNFIDQVSLIIFDEFHKIQDWDRGFLLETLMTFLMLKQDFWAHFKILTISAIVDDLQNINTWFWNDNWLFQSTWIPTRKMYWVLSQWYHVSTSRNETPYDLIIKYNNIKGNIPNLIKIITRKNKNWEVISPKYINIVIELVKNIYKNDNSPILIYFQSKKSWINSFIKNENIIKYWSIFWELFLDKVVEKNELYNYMKLRLSEEHPLTKLVKYWIWIHNWDLPKDIRIEVEKAYKDWVIKLLLSTSTLAEWVNLWVKNLIFHNTNSLSLSDYRNVIWRVWRALSDTEWNIYFIWRSQKFLSQSNEKLSILSSYDKIKIKHESYDFLDYITTVENTLNNEDKVNFNRMQVFIYSIYEYLKNESNEITLEEIKTHISWKTLYLSTKDEEKRKQFHLYNKSNYDEVIDMYDNHRDVLNILNKTWLSKTSFLKLRELIWELSENYEDTQFIFYSTDFSKILPQEYYKKILEIYEFQKILDKYEFIDLDNYNILLDWMSWKSFIELRDTYFSEKFPDISKRTSKAVAYLSSMFEYILPWAFSSLSIIVEWLFNFPDDVKNEFKILPLKVKHWVSSNDWIELVKAWIEFHELLVELEKLYLKEKEESEEFLFVWIWDWILNYSFYKLKKVLLILENNTSYIKNIWKVKNKLREKSNVLEEEWFLEFEISWINNYFFRSKKEQLIDINKFLFERDFNNIYDVFAIRIYYPKLEWWYWIVWYFPSKYSEEVSEYLKNNNNNLKVISLDKIWEKIILKIINK